MEKAQTRKRRLWVAAVAVNLLFIWGNSLMPGHISAAFSRFVGNVLSVFFPGEGMEELPAGEGIVRKIAHLLEFCTLGFFLSGLLKNFQKSILFSFPAGALAGALDECIQLLVPDRGPHIRDVGIDALGVLVGIGIFAAVLALRRRKKQTIVEEKK